MDGEKFKAIRLRLRLSQTELGNRLDLSLRYIRLLEQGERPIDGRTALAMKWLAKHEKPAKPEPGRGAVPERGPRRQEVD